MMFPFPTKSSYNRTQAYLVSIFGILIWSITGPLISYLISAHGVPAILLAFWRNLLMCAGLAAAFFLIKRDLLRIRKNDLLFYVVYGLVLALYNAVWFISARENGAAVATVLGYSSAGFTAILSFTLFREKLGFSKLLAVFLSLSGCVLVSNAWDPEIWNLNPTGIVSGILSGVLFAAYTLLGREAANREIPTWTALLWSFAAGTVFLFLFCLVPSASPSGNYGLVPVMDGLGWGTLILLSLGPSIMGFGLYNASIKYLSATIANLLATLEPVFTAIQAYIFLGERMSRVQIVGALVIIAAMFAAHLSAGKKHR